MILKGATYKYVPEIDDGPRAKYKAIVLHTCVCSSLHWPDPSRPGVGSHLFVDKDGDLTQYLDTDRMTYHAGAANTWTVGLESYDGGADPALGWNAAQLATIHDVCKQLGVPGQLLKETPSDGVGWHKQHPSWNPNNHSCPGVNRIAQVTSIVIPALRAPSGGGPVSSSSDAWQTGYRKAQYHIIEFVEGQKVPYSYPTEPDLFKSPDEHLGWDQRMRDYLSEQNIAAIKTKLGA